MEVCYSMIEIYSSRRFFIAKASIKLIITLPWVQNVGKKIWLVSAKGGI